MSAFPALLSPVTVGPVELRNRVVSTSHQTTLVHDHLPTDDLVAYHAARARGGVGAIILEATAVHPTGLLTAHTLAGYHDAMVGGYERLAGAVRPHGTRIFVQLFHGGREQISAPPRAPAVAPSAVPSTRFKSEPRALTVAELGEMLDGYRAAARNAREGGLDGIEISMAHGYLVAQFFGRESNRRTDGYNGQLDARLRFAREVLAAVREGAGDGLAVGVRLAADELGPGLLDVDACAEIAAELSGDGAVDFVSLALGHSATYAASTYIAPPPPTPLDMIAEPGAVVRRAVAPVPVLSTTRVHDLSAAERMVAEGQADLVGMTRALIADPDLVAKATEGRAAEVIECIGCNQACIGHYHAGVPIGCVVNPRTGRERTAPVFASAPSGERVLVVGAGPAGVAAALEAAAAGDTVTLAERDDDIGGQLRLAGDAPAHRETWERYRRSMRGRLERSAVDLRLGHAVAEADLEGYDRVVLATGARPYVPPFLDAAPCRTVQAWDAIADPAAIEGPVLVADWGGDWAGLDAAEVLADAGREVMLACAATVPGETLHQYQRNLYLARLDTAGVRVLHHTELAEVDGALVLRHAFSQRTQPLPAVATLVLALGRAPADALWASLEGRPGCVRAGDVLSPRTAEEAVLEGAGTAWERHGA
jgi:2,4-dienoyl-CoA reductase-like NADH-dependent reductase (Old Yellow Enzyme family)/thioredoxin reductase